MSIPTPKWRCDLCGAGQEMFGKHHRECVLYMPDRNDKLAEAGIADNRTPYQMLAEEQKNTLAKLDYTREELQATRTQLDAVTAERDALSEQIIKLGALRNACIGFYHDFDGANAWPLCVDTLKDAIEQAFGVETTTTSREVPPRE